ncbi:acyl transferase/acyl hydrolase/lysophospholipase [Stachybotrys elegans]|uniref:Acyl transferase/acyl hydrolase/lysophospholipase n=1 Tax=Stachybotrys elegans TaxID=80388 RepID=A0A8K0SUT8_9HYPO|nr:acyl transferase/acyl hydrolase/lysophospholipase [Stachybotrys elegans]
MLCQVGDDHGQDLGHPKQSEDGIKLLSLDGGGIRGLSSLIILKHLMKNIRPSDPPKPCEYFDLIGGTSTGGIITIMLGRLRMGVDECIEKYMDLASDVFQPKRSKGNLWGKGRDWLTAGGKYRSEGLATQFKSAAQQAIGDKEALLLDPDGPCKVFVCAQAKANSTTALLRSYTTHDSIDHLSLSRCTIWEAARATSAASGFFDPIVIGDQSYVDGATACNNPVEKVFQEAKSLWSDLGPRLQCLVSIGTGVSKAHQFGDNIFEIVNSLKHMAIETEETEKRFYTHIDDYGIKELYFRFNVTTGLTGVKLDDVEKRPDIEAATEAYLAEPRTRKTLQNVAEARPALDGMIQKEALRSSHAHIILSTQNLFQKPEKTSTWPGSLFQTLAEPTQTPNLYDQMMRPASGFSMTIF